MIWRNAVPVPLTEVGLPHEERCRVVLADHDPRVELPEVDIRVRTRPLGNERDLASHTRDTEADDEEPGGLDEIATGRHAITSLSSVRADAIVFAARLIAD
jgi:hypothetical protein